MTSTAATTLSTFDANRSVISRAGWCWVGVLSTLFVALHWSFVVRMIRIATLMDGGESLWQAVTHIIRERWNPDWSHVLVIPLISLFFVARNLDKIKAAPQRIDPKGLVIFILGLLSFLWWVYPGRNFMLQGLSMIIALFGMVLFLMGPARMRGLWFPIVYMVFFVRISYRIWTQIANTLQNVAASCATFVLKLFTLVFNFEVNTVGNTIKIMDSAGATHPLNIAEACSGLRMLMAFVALGVAMAYFVERAWWQRLIMVLMTVPIAVAVNVGRVTTLGLLTLVNEQMTKGDFHTMVGMFMLIPAAGLFWLLGWVLDKMIIVDARPAPVTGMAATGAAAARVGDAKPTSDRWDRQDLMYALKGVIAGALLTGLIGLNYFLLFTAFQPQRANISQTVAIILLAAALVLLAGGWVVIRRVLLQGRRGAATDDQTPDSARLRLAWPRQSTTIALGIVAGVLGTSLAGFSAAIEFNKIVLDKLPLPLRDPLYRLPRKVGNWVCIDEGEPLTEELLQTLGTSEYISWTFRDGTWPANKPGREVRLHVAYYTGSVDTVRHVADRCIAAAGGQSIGANVHQTLHVSGSQYRASGKGYTAPSLRQQQGVFVPSLDVPITIFRYRYPGQGDAVHSVAYFFVANGRFVSMPEMVRLKGFDPRDRYIYHCKVELQMHNVGDPDLIVQRGSEFLSLMLPNIMAALPDWQKVTAGDATATGEAEARQ